MDESVGQQCVRIVDEWLNKYLVPQGVAISDGMRCELYDAIADIVRRERAGVLREAAKECDFEKACDCADYLRARAAEEAGNE